MSSPPDLNPALADPAARARLLHGLAHTCIIAGAEIMRIFEDGFAVEKKLDASPVTIADRAAEAILLQALASLAPGIPVVAEEEAAAGRIPDIGTGADRAFFLVDALDGTREFVRRGRDFTVNVGLVEGERATLGVVYIPAQGRLYVGDAVTGEAWTATDLETPRTPLRVRACTSAPVALASKSHDVPQTEAYLAAVGSTERLSFGSSLKFCMVAEGRADLYPRPSPTMEWDTAAGDAVLRAAGGQVFGPDGGELRYGKPGFHNPGFVAVGPFPAPPIGPFMRP